MRISIVLTALFAASPALADFQAPPAKIPTLQDSGVSIDEFAPKGWVVEARAEGDLDGDKSPDVAFVLHGTDPALIVKNDGLGPKEVDTNPRIIGVAVSREGGYQLVAQNATLIPRNDMPTREDPFDARGFSISRGALKVDLAQFMSAGGWGSGSVSFVFRVRNDRLETIGYDRTDTQRNTGEVETVSVNYLTGKMSVAKGSIERDKDDSKVWTKLKARAPSIDQIGDGLDFDPKPSLGGDGGR